MAAQSKPTIYGWFWGNAGWNKNSPDGCRLQTIINQTILPQNVPLYNSNPKGLQVDVTEFANQYPEFRKYPRDSFRQAVYRAIKHFQQGKVVDTPGANPSQNTANPKSSSASPAAAAEQSKEEFREAQNNWKSAFALGMVQGRTGGVNRTYFDHCDITTDNTLLSYQLNLCQVITQRTTCLVCHRLPCWQLLRSPKVGLVCSLACPDNNNNKVECQWTHLLFNKSLQLWV